MVNLLKFVHQVNLNASCLKYKKNTLPIVALESNLWRRQIKYNNNKFFKLGICSSIVLLLII